MNKYVYEAHRYADEGAREREQEEVYGRLRLALFWGFLGLMAITVVKAIHFAPPQWLAWVIIGTAPIAVIVFVVNYLRLPTDCKLEGSVLVMGFITLSLAAGTTALTRIFSLLSPGASP